MSIEEFIGKKAEYSNDCQMIFGVRGEGEMQLILDVRGWGAIQNIFMDKNGKVDIEESFKFQDELGEWIADAINQKLTPNKPH